MNEKEEPMNMNVTPPVEPVTEFEVHLPPDRKHPKWLVPLIAGVLPSLFWRLSAPVDTCIGAIIS